MDHSEPFENAFRQYADQLNAYRLYNVFAVLATAIRISRFCCTCWPGMHKRPMQTPGGVWHWHTPMCRVWAVLDRDHVK